MTFAELEQKLSAIYRQWSISIEATDNVRCTIYLSHIAVQGSGADMETAVNNAIHKLETSGAHAGYC